MTEPIDEAADHHDAALLAAVVRGFQEWQAATGRTPATKVLREALWFFWQKPRLGPRVRGKYPTAAPWTAAARAAYAADPRCALVIEHVRPVNLLVRELLTGAGTTATVLATLRAEEQFCVVTPEEDDALEAAGVGDRFDGTDPWSRYVAAGIDLTGLAPLLPAEQQR